MKKLLAAALALALLLPGCVFAELDPIYGDYCMIIDGELNPEFMTNVGDYDKIVCVYSFLANGTILLTENDIKDGIGTMVTNTAGKWENNGGTYTYSILGIGSGDLFLDDNAILLSITSNNVTIYLRLRKAAAFNPYEDYVLYK